VRSSAAASCGEGEAGAAGEGAAEDGAGDTGVAAAGSVGLADAAGLGEATGAATLSRMEPCRGLTSDNPRLETMKSPARMVVARESTLADPRGPKAVWVPPPPKALARSWPLPCWSRTTAIRNRQATM